jgi:hypothetical protein
MGESLRFGAWEMESNFYIATTVRFATRQHEFDANGAGIAREGRGMQTGDLLVHRFLEGLLDTIVYRGGVPLVEVESIERHRRGRLVVG